MKIHKIFAFGMMLIMVSLFSGGCQVAGTDIVISTGLGEEDLFKIGNEVCTFQEAMIFIANQKNFYEAAYTDEIWATDVEGMTYEEYLLNHMKNFLAQLKCMKLMAQEKQIVLTVPEEERIALAAETYYSGLSETEIESVGLTEEQVRIAYEDYYLANKVMDEVTKGVDIEISDGEAKVIHIQQILIRNYELDLEGNRVPFEGDQLTERGTLAENILARANEEGTDFLALAKEFSDEDTVEFTYVRGQLTDELEQIAFSLEDQQVSGLIETDYGFYIMKCVSAYDQEATQLHKIEMARQRKLDRFKEEYNAFTANVVSEFNWELWDSIQLSEDGNLTTSNFMEIYDNILKND